MHVRLLAHTVVKWEESFDIFGAPSTPADTWAQGVIASDDTDSDLLAEFAGRSCYESYSKPNPATATNQGYLGNILSQEHYSVLEHASATFYITGISRSLTHELIRHRHLSFSELSQRFVKMDDAEFVVPPLIEEWKDVWCVGVDVVSGEMSKQAYREIASDLQANASSVSRKQIREAARAVLPNNIETKIVVTGNLRAWRDVIKKRNSEHADAEIKMLAQELLVQLKDLAPNTFQDMT